MKAAQATQASATPRSARERPDSRPADPLAASREFMLADLKRSGLPDTRPEVIRVEPLPIDATNARTQPAGGPGHEKPFTGYLWPAYRIWYCGGHWRDRFEAPEDQRKIVKKYRGPVGVNALYTPTEENADAWAESPTKWLIEGEKKCAKFIAATGLPAVGVPGCWNAIKKDGEGYVLHEALAATLQPGDRVVVAFDGDITDPDKNVGTAARLLKEVLEQHHVSCEFLLLPDDLGMDDWLVRERFKTREEAIAAVEKLRRIDPEHPDQLGVRASDVIEERLLRPPRTLEQVLAPAAVEYAVTGLIERGQRGIVGGMGGAGKTTMLIHLGICHALGRPFMGRTVQQGSFMLVSGDDDEEALDEALRRHLLDGGYTAAEQQQVEKHLRLVSVSDTIGGKVIEPADYGRSFEPTVFAHALLRTLGKVPDLVGVVLDTARQFSGQDSSNEQAMTALIGISNAITALPQRPYAAFTHHLNKTSARTGSLDVYGLTGSGTLIDSNRFALLLHQLTDKEVEDLMRVSSVSKRIDTAGASWIAVFSGRGALLTSKAPPFVYTRTGEWHCKLYHHPDARMADAEERKTEAASEKERLRILDKLKDATKPVSHRDLMSTANPTNRKAREAALAALVAERVVSQSQVVRSGNSTYQYTLTQRPETD